MRYFCYVIFIFAKANSAILLVEYKFMTHGVWNFMEESENRKTI